MFEPLSYYSKDYEELFQYYECDGCMWYSYDYLMDKFGYSNIQKGNCWKNFIQEDEKRIFMEEISTFDGKHKHTKEHKYINTSGILRLLSRFSQGINKIRNGILDLEYELGYINSNDNNNHCLQVNLGLMEQYINDNDVDKVFEAAKAVCKSDTIQSIMHGDPVKEEAINEYRSLLYDECEDDIEEIYINVKMTKRSDIPNEEERKVLYKRNRENKTKSTCPSWLKDCLR